MAADYAGLQTVWAGLTGTTAQKLASVNAMTVTGTIPTTLFSTGPQIANCINWTEFAALPAATQQNVLLLCLSPGPLLGGSANTAFLTDGMILAAFPANATITSGTYNSSTGVVTLTMSATIGFGVGGTITVKSLTGTGAFASLNGIFPTIAPTSGTTVTYNAGAGLGASTITGGAITPPTITALTALAQATVQPWWFVHGFSGPIGTADLQLAGGLT